MIFELRPKSIGITKEQVWSAWKRIKQGGKGVGIDNVTIEMIEKESAQVLIPCMEQNGKWKLFSACSSGGVHT